MSFFAWTFLNFLPRCEVLEYLTTYICIYFFQESGTNFVGIKTATSSENLLNNNAKNCHELKPIRGDKKVQRKSAVK